MPRDLSWRDMWSVALNKRREDTRREQLRLSRSEFKRLVALELAESTTFDVCDGLPSCREL